MHQDGSWLRLLKLFIYLDDITEDNGPFAFVPSSRFQSAKFPALSGRVPDDQVKEWFGKDAIKHATGPAGTMHFCDTRNLHRGTPVNKGHRTVVQLEFACTLYRPDVDNWIPVPDKGERNDFVMDSARKRMFMRFRPESVQLQKDAA
jgi:Phytanoyl-CoA dioxygenase (PhyH)